MSVRIEEEGNFYGRLEVRKAVNTKRHGLKWACRCECGTYALLRGCDFRSGRNRSCKRCTWAAKQTSRALMDLALDSFGPKE